MYTTDAVAAASSWMIDNGFEEGKCTERSAASLKLRYVPPKPTKSKGESDTNATEANLSETTPKPTKKGKTSTNSTSN